jgi:hypothetical protein
MMPTTTPSPTKVHPTTKRAPQERDDPERLRSAIHEPPVRSRAPPYSRYSPSPHARRRRDRRHAP